MRAMSDNDLDGVDIDRLFDAIGRRYPNCALIYLNVKHKEEDPDFVFMHRGMREAVYGMLDLAAKRMADRYLDSFEEIDD